PADQIKAATTVFLGPCDHAPVAGFQCGFPSAVGLETLAVGVEMLQRFGRDVLRQPFTHFGAEGVMFGGVGQVHQYFAVLPPSTKASRAFWLSSCMYISSVKPCSKR